MILVKKSVNELVNLWLEPKFKQDTINYFLSIKDSDDTSYIISLLEFYTAPTRIGPKLGTLVNLRCSGRNLRSCWQENKIQVEKILSLKSMELKSSDDSVLVYFYDSERLVRKLNQKRVKAFLAKCGYESCTTTQQFLEKLKENFSNGSTCPHEVGIFLGYPLKDVIAFYKKDTVCKCIGYWKCYSNVFLSQFKFFVYDLSKWSVTRRRLSNIQ